MVNQSKLATIISWLVAGAQPPKSIDEIVEETALRLNDAGVAIDALVLNGLFIHPHFRGIQIRWTRKRGRSRETFTHDFMESHFFHKTSTFRVLETGRTQRFKFDDFDPAPDQAFEGGYKRSGITELVLLPLFNVDGSVTGVAEIGTKHPGGFTEDQFLALRRVQAPLARIKEYFTELFDKQITLATYVGEETSRKVLSGKIVLGDGETISAVVLFADIKGFTELSNARPSEEVLQVLNRFYAQIDAAVSRNNGEILKFMGDGVLVIFPTPDDLTAQEAAASAAVDSVALARQSLSDPKLEFRASLHIGEVFFGNIGSGNRLDFTAIGPTVNLASRMLEEASRREAGTVCSTEFKAIALGLSAEKIECDFRGFNAPIEIFVID